MPTTTNPDHQRELLTACLQRLLEIDEALTRQPDDTALLLERRNVGAQIAQIAGAEMPDLLTLVQVTGLHAEARESLERQRAQLTDTQHGLELQRIVVSTTERVTLTLALRRVAARLEQIDQLLAQLAAEAAPTQPAPRPGGPSGLTPAQLRRLVDALARCEECFDTNRDLRALFGDPRLALWRSGLPEADGLRARIDRLIDYLRPKRTSAGQAGLTLLLRVLADRYDPSDARQPELLALARELE